MLVVCTALLLASCGTYKSLHHVPVTEGYNATIPVITRSHNDSVATYGDNFLLQNKHGLYEMYVEGDPYQLGLINGALSQNLISIQEHSFLDKLKEIVPSKFKLGLLRQFLKWYNRKLYLHVPEEYKTEIYGLSRYASKDYDDVAPPYLRMLYLHAAHDIGHALTDLSMVGCTSFAAWGNNTSDGKLLLARNLDFYAGDTFAQNKIVLFIKPDKGYPFMSVTWGGMIGTLSGMNSQGLTITLNAGRSDIPTMAKTPISLLAREILQYASTINEAIAIAKKHEVFVSESLMIGSANDHKAVLIEMSPNKFGVYDVPNSTQIICSNHFQSEAYKDDKNNAEAIADSHSEYRFERMTQLLEQSPKVDPAKAATIMRNTNGLNGKAIGYGNEKAINQLLAHHSVIFKPEQKLVWVSSNPYQLGAYVAYNLDEVFGTDHKNSTRSVAIDSLLIPEDKFVHSAAFKNYEQYRIKDRQIEDALETGDALPQDFISAYQLLNPEFWEVYYKAGVYNYKRGYYAVAKVQFEKALTKEITTQPDKLAVEAYLKKTNNKLK